MVKQLKTPLTELLGIQHPVILAGMNVAAGPDLAAAVSNAGGLGVIGGVNYTPKQLQKTIDTMKKGFDHPDRPFGVDLLLPKVGEGARKTNYDYTGGQLPQLIDIIIQSGARLFVSAVGVPEKWVIEKLHSAGILVMNMVGSPKHVKYAIDAGVDLICAQGGEGGGHTGDIPTSLLIPACVDACKGHKSPLTGHPVYVVAAGGIYDGRGLAMSLALGAQAAWVGTRFVCAKEAGAPPKHQKAIINADYTDTYRTLVYTGRPMRIVKNKYIDDWHENRAGEIKQLLAKGVLPYNYDMDNNPNPPPMHEVIPNLSGQVAGAIKDVKPAKEIVEEMVNGAVDILTANYKMVSKL